MTYESDEIKKKAFSAKDKKASLGDDLDLDKYSTIASPNEPIDDLTVLGKEEQQTLRMSGVIPEAHNRAGTFVLMDASVVHNNVSQKGVEILNTGDALEKYPWLKKYWWQTVAVDTDKYTAFAELEGKKEALGYFVRVLPGVKTTFPIQSCLYLSQDNISQNVHNILIVEEGASLDIITGCATSRHVQQGAHIGVSEFFVKRYGRLSFTMIHNWKPKVEVRPRSAAIVDEGGIFLSNYICMQPVRSLQMYPTTKMVGRNATVRYNSILLAPPKTELDIGSRVHLKAPGCRAEVISRAISAGGKIWARGHLIGDAPEVKAHLECLGLLLKEGGFIHAIPQLEGSVPNIDLSHEAAVGKIAKEEVEYLMARGLTEEEATATIVRGFLDVKIEGLPPELQSELDKVIDTSRESML
ncbi:MAG: SufD family Fe-S cluster assembly protein [Promethearchaeota archaeon]